MKKIIPLILTLAVIASCSKEKVKKDYVSLTGKIENSKDSVLSVVSQDFKKDIALNAGVFKDTLKVNKAGFYTILLNKQQKGFMYLANGFDLTVNSVSDNLIEDAKYTGEGSESNNFLMSQYAFGRSIGNPQALFALNKEVFTAKINSLEKGFDSIKGMYKNIDSTLIAKTSQQNINMFKALRSSYDNQHENAVKMAEAKKDIAKGKLSPQFKNYVDFKGGKKSLADFKGKYVYIDLWATWCNPCIAEIPALKKVEEQYHGKNIAFVSISLDNERTAGSWDKAEDKWRKMVADKNLGGIQLYTGKDLEFTTKYQVTGIPRFILIDPNGNIVSSEAPRPSDTKLIDLFTELGI